MLQALAETVFPAVCPGCGGRGEPICAGCARTVAPAPTLAAPPGLDALIVPFAYTGVVRELVARAKYRQRHAALRWIAAAMANALGATAPPSIDVVTWAPTTASRRRARGFDQAEMLAVAVGRAHRRPCRGLLRRVGHDHQTGRSRAERLDGPAFVVRHATSVRGRSVLLVDDVVTTGATLRAAASMLRDAGAVRVIGLAAAARP